MENITMRQILRIGKTTLNPALTSREKKIKNTTPNERKNNAKTVYAQHNPATATSYPANVRTLSKPHKEATHNNLFRAGDRPMWSWFIFRYLPPR